jgi:hypothetical protein
MKTLLPASVLLLFCLTATGLAFSGEARSRVHHTRSRLTHWLTETLWQLDMQRQGLVRNEDAGGVYFSDPAR